MLHVHCNAGVHQSPSLLCSFHFNRFFAPSVPMAKPEIREQVKLPNRLFCCRGRLNCCDDRECDISVRETNADLNFIIIVQNHLGQLSHNDQDLQLLRNPSLYDLNSNILKIKSCARGRTRRRKLDGELLSTYLSNFKC